IEGSYPSAEVIRDVYGVLLATGLKRIELSASEIAKRAGVRNEMAVQSTLYLLERAGHIHRLANSRNFDTASNPPWAVNPGTAFPGTSHTGTAGVSPAASTPHSTHQKPSRAPRAILMLDNVRPAKLRVTPADVERRADLERRKLREMIEFCYTEH